MSSLTIWQESKKQKQMLFVRKCNCSIDLTLQTKQICRTTVITVMEDPCTSSAMRLLFSRCTIKQKQLWRLENTIDINISIKYLQGPPYVLGCQETSIQEGL